MHADHAFEMLLKAVIHHRGGEIRRAGDAYTIGTVTLTSSAPRFDRPAGEYWALAWSIY